MAKNRYVLFRRSFFYALVVLSLASYGFTETSPLQMGKVQLLEPVNGIQTGLIDVYFTNPLEETVFIKDRFMFSEMKGYQDDQFVTNNTSSSSGPPRFPVGPGKTIRLQVWIRLTDKRAPGLVANRFTFEGSYFTGEFPDDGSAPTFEKITLPMVECAITEDRVLDVEAEIREAVNDNDNE